MNLTQNYHLAIKNMKLIINNIFQHIKIFVIIF